MPRDILRRCVSCRTLLPRCQLLRVVRLSSSSVVRFQIGMGRSAYVCRQPECMHTAHKKRRLDKALRVPVPDYVYEQLWRELSSA
ncbi:MAG: YlxR family protein [Cyanobacteria bacterium P01_D01_bin.123]